MSEPIRIQSDDVTSRQSIVFIHPAPPAVCTGFNPSNSLETVSKPSLCMSLPGKELQRHFLAPTTTATALYYMPLHTTTLHYAPLCTTTLHYMPLHATTHHYALQRFTMCHYTPLHATMLHYTPLCVMGSNFNIYAVACKLTELIDWTHKQLKRISFAKQFYSLCKPRKISYINKLTKYNISISIKTTQYEPN